MGKCSVEQHVNFSQITSIVATPKKHPFCPSEFSKCTNKKGSFFGAATCVSLEFHGIYRKNHGQNGALKYFEMGEINSDYADYGC